MDRLGRIPQRRDVVELDGWRLQVLTMHRRRVVQVMVEKTHYRPLASPRCRPIGSELRGPISSGA